MNGARPSVYRLPATSASLQEVDVWLARTDTAVGHLRLLEIRPQANYVSRINNNGLQKRLFM